MRKLIPLLMCLFGMGMSYAEEVSIGLTNDESLEVMPGYFFLDNKPVIYEFVKDDIFKKDVIVYDYNLNPSIVHFNNEYVEATYIDCRFNCFVNDYTPFTQCFFNNDALYEALAVDVETEIDLSGYEKRLYSNFRIINQNGDVLYTFETPEGYKYIPWIKGTYCQKVSDDIIIVEVSYRNNDDYCTCYYSLKVGQTNSLAPIKQMHEMKLDKNTVTKGDNLVITVGTDSRQSAITVISVSGMKVKEVPVVEGRAIVDTSDMQSGLYIVSQKRGASAKFLVK